MLALAVRLLLLGTPVLSDADLRIVERLAWRAGVPKGTVESLSTDVTGDGAPDTDERPSTAAGDPPRMRRRRPP